MRLNLLLLALITLISIQTQDDEHPTLRASSPEFTESARSAMETLRTAGFQNGLQTPALGSLPSAEFDRLLSNIREEKPLSGVSEGTPATKYDVILQPGHYGRPPGPVGTSGQLVSERALVAFITNVIASELRRDGSAVLIVSADKYLRPNSGQAGFDGLRAKVFLAIHADGSIKPCSTGPSLGYRSSSSLLAMHAVGWSLAAALGYKYTDFNRDNFTVNEARYYMFKNIQADRLTGLLEIGELTCPASEKDLISSSTLIGQNIAKALTFITKTPQVEGSHH